jgi:hypothetical protein
MVVAGLRFGSFPMVFVAQSNPIVVAFQPGGFQPFSLLAPVESPSSNIWIAFADQVLSGRTCELVLEFFYKTEFLCRGAPTHPGFSIGASDPEARAAESAKVGSE